MHDALISLSRLFIVDFTLRGSTVSNMIAKHLTRIVRSNTAIERNLIEQRSKSANALKPSDEDKRRHGQYAQPTVITLDDHVCKLVSVLLILSTASAATSPALLSTPRGLRTIMAMASYTHHICILWGGRNQFIWKGLRWKGTDGETVVLISKVETRASLWVQCAWQSWIW